MRFKLMGVLSIVNIVGAAFQLHDAHYFMGVLELLIGVWVFPPLELEGA